MSNDAERLPVFFDEWGFGIHRDSMGYVVVFGDVDMFAYTPQRYDTFESAKQSIKDYHDE